MDWRLKALDPAVWGRAITSAGLKGRGSKTKTKQDFRTREIRRGPRKAYRRRTEPRVDSLARLLPGIAICICAPCGAYSLSYVISTYTLRARARILAGDPVNFWPSCSSYPTSSLASRKHTLVESALQATSSKGKRSKLQSHKLCLWAWG